MFATLFLSVNQWQRMEKRQQIQTSWRKCNDISHPRDAEQDKLERERAVMVAVVGAAITGWLFCNGSGGGWEWKPGMFTKLMSVAFSQYGAGCTL